MYGGAGSGCDVADDIEASAAMAVPAAGAASAQATPSAPIQRPTKMRNPSVSRALFASDTRFANAVLDDTVIARRAKCVADRFMFLSVRSLSASGPERRALKRQRIIDQ